MTTKNSSPNSKFAGINLQEQLERKLLEIYRDDVTAHLSTLWKIKGILSKRVFNHEVVKSHYSLTFKYDSYCVYLAATEL